MSGLGQERTCRWVRVMSIILPKANIRTEDQDVCLVRIPDVNEVLDHSLVHDVGFVSTEKP
jgi:hypothetical protein